MQEEWRRRRGKGEDLVEDVGLQEELLGGGVEEGGAAEVEGGEDEGALPGEEGGEGLDQGRGLGGGRAGQGGEHGQHLLPHPRLLRHLLVKLPQLLHQWLRLDALQVQVQTDANNRLVCQ